ncbi:MAG: baseplate J/gp47 family protein [Bacilli bacterium]|nr:baseplate J/gp47 family protein [Bacilli bacterium]
MANYEYNTTTGIVVPDTSQVKIDVENEFRSALGQDLDVSASTPQGRLIEVETVARKRVIENMALLANMFNKDQAFGIWLDVILKFFGADREGATATKVVCQLEGEAGTSILANAQAKDTSGNIYYLENSVTLDENGEGEGTFVCMIKGAIECQANTLTQIVTAILGWNSINNASAGVTGKEGESDNQARLKLSVTQYKGEGQKANIKNAILQVENVVDCKVLENYTNGSIIEDGITITAPHSIYVCVDGGNDTEIAQAIVRSKSGGSAFGADLNNTSAEYLVTEETEGTTVRFARPTQVPVQIKVTLKSGQAIADNITKVKQAIIDYANGKFDEVEGLNIGSDVSPFEIASAITIAIPELYINQVQASKLDDTLGTAVVLINANEIATIDETNITVE